MALTVGKVARLAGVTTRTLHHYDEIGLLAPSGRTDAGYRIYTEEDLATLHQILVYRELGFELARIRQILAAETFDRIAALVQQRRQIADRKIRLEAVIENLDLVIETEKNGMTMNTKDMFEVFGDFNPAEYEAEVERRWSGPAVDESRRRTSSYTKADWQQIGSETDEISRAFAALATTTARPTSAEAIAVAERHRLHINQWFYTCDHQMHRGLGIMYTEDHRFAAYWDKYAPGLAGFVRHAIEANAVLHEDGGRIT